MKGPQEGSSAAIVHRDKPSGVPSKDGIFNPTTLARNFCHVICRWAPPKLAELVPSRQESEAMINTTELKPRNELSRHWLITYSATEVRVSIGLPTHGIPWL